VLVAKVRSALNLRSQNAASQPEFLSPDRGRGFHFPSSGDITTEYEQALAENNLQAFMGGDASHQHGSMQNFLLHEPAVSWLRHRLAQSTLLRKHAFGDVGIGFGTHLKPIQKPFSRQHCTESTLPVIRGLVSVPT
jgi:hypothetical protein